MSDRLPPIPGEWIDRSQRIDFIFEGDRIWGYAGDTITSALWASGKRVLGRSFKYHRPRGILSFANHDINALMQDGQTLNVRADVTPLEAGMSLCAVNTDGGVWAIATASLTFSPRFSQLGFTTKPFTISGCFPSGSG
jgi:sarcosine oxidase subunit alpha